MKKHEIKSVMVTSINMDRLNLITKEKMESYCKGGNNRKDSVNDDLESLFENILLGKEPDEYVQTYFLPKLTEEELELVERRNTSYLQTFRRRNPDVDETEMMLSKSDSKYVDGWSRQKTFVIENNPQLSFEELTGYYTPSGSFPRRVPGRKSDPRALVHRSLGTIIRVMDTCGPCLALDRLFAINLFFLIIIVAKEKWKIIQIILII